MKHILKCSLFLLGLVFNQSSYLYGAEAEKELRGSWSSTGLSMVSVSRGHAPAEFSFSNFPTAIKEIVADYFGSSINIQEIAQIPGWEFVQERTFAWKDHNRTSLDEDTFFTCLQTAPFTNTRVNLGYQFPQWKRLATLKSEQTGMGVSKKITDLSFNIFGDSDSTTQDHIAAVLKQCFEGGRLENLDITMRSSSPGVYFNGFVNIASFITKNEGLKNLRKLELCECFKQADTTSRNMMHLTDLLPCCINLEELTLPGWGSMCVPYNEKTLVVSKETLGGLFDAVTKIPTLRVLNIQRTRFGADGIGMKLLVQRFKNLRQLERLDLSHNNLGAESFPVLFQSLPVLENLESLGIEGNYFMDWETNQLTLGTMPLTIPPSLRRIKFGDEESPPVREAILKITFPEGSRCEIISNASGGRYRDVKDHKSRFRFVGGVHKSQRQ